MFELTRPTTALLVSVTARAENNGDDKAPAVSLGLSIDTTAAALESLCPDVRQLLAVAGVQTVSLHTVCEGWTVLIDHGIDEDDPIKLGGCKLDKFKISPKNDDAVELRFRVGSRDLDPMRLGLMGMKVQQDIVVKITAPQGASQTSSDDQARALQKQRAQEAAGQQRLDNGEPDTPESALARAHK